MTLHRSGVKAAAARRVRDALREEITLCGFKDGLLPSESVLMARENASRTAVRMALNLLRSEGLIRRLQGLGTLMDQDSHVPFSLDRARSASSAIPGGRYRIRYEPLSIRVTEPSSGIADRLEIGTHEQVLFLERLTYLDDRPFSLSSIWIPAIFATEVINGDASADLGVPDLLCLSPGQKLGASQYSIEATAADEAVTGILDVALGSPLLLLVALNHLHDGRPGALQYVRSRADRIRYELPAVSPGT